MAMIGLLGSGVFSSAFADNVANIYQEQVFVANKAAYHPALGVEKNMVNAWGIAIRPAGAGGHFWITAKDTSYEYVGDVTQSQDAKLKSLHQDTLKEVKVPLGKKGEFTTSTVYLDSKDKFIIQQDVKGVDPINAPAKFLFASDGGIISAWTERKKPDGTFDRPVVAKTVIDESAEGSQFFGIAASHDYSRIYAANFGKNPGVKTYDGNFKLLPVVFDNPFDGNKNGRVDAGEYAPFNVMQLKTPKGEDHIFVTYAKTRACDTQAIAENLCKQGEILAGEEDASVAGNGRLAEFTEAGKLVKIWDDKGSLTAPWGMAFAPAHFGVLSGKLLVANFGSGTIAAFDPETGAYLADIEDKKDHSFVISGIWGLVFGNGASLGDANALYFTAGPDDEKDGVFGSIRVSGQ